MDEQEYRQMAEADDRIWWYRGLHDNIAWGLRRSGTGPTAAILDAGCGTGGLLLALRRGFPKAALEGVEQHAPAVAIARQRTGLPVREGSLHALPFPDASFDAVTVSDVLYHRDADPEKALPEIRRVLKPGGVFVSSEVAFEWLRSYHDEQVHTARRFTRGAMNVLLRKHGFSPERSSYWNFFLLPVLVLRRKILKPPPGQSDVHPYAPWMDALFRGFMRAENLGLRAGIRWPVGSSLLTISRRLP